MQLEEVNNSTIKNIKGIDRKDSNDKDIMNDPEKIVPNDRMDNKSHVAWDLLPLNNKALDL